PRGAHRARSALSASTARTPAEARAARETPGVLGRNGEAPSDRSSGASVYRPSPSVGDERKMAPAPGLEPGTRRLTAACSGGAPTVPCSPVGLRASCLPQASGSAPCSLVLGRVELCDYVAGLQ